MDQEAIAVADAALPDEHLQSASAGSASKEQSGAPPTQAAAPASADPNAASAPAKEGEQPNPDAQPQEQPQKFKGGFQKRIDELTRERHAAAREAAYWRQQAEARAQAAPPQQEKPEPRLADFQDFEQFMKARDEWVADRVHARIRSENELAAREQEQQRQRNESAIQHEQVVQRFVAAEEDAATRYPDYHQVVQSPLMQEFKQVRPDVAQAVIDSDHGPDIVYFLAKNPAQVHTIARLSPIAAAREIGRIEQMFMQPKAQSTNAPPPPRQVGGNAQVERRPEDMSMKEYRAWRNRK